MVGLEAGSYFVGVGCVNSGEVKVVSIVKILIFINLISWTDDSIDIYKAKLKMSSNLGLQVLNLTIVGTVSPTTF